MEIFDVVVIGAGPGGYPAAIRAALLCHDRSGHDRPGMISRAPKGKWRAVHGHILHLSGGNSRTEGVP